MAPLHVTILIHESWNCRVEAMFITGYMTTCPPLKAVLGRRALSAWGLFKWQDLFSLHRLFPDIMSILVGFGILAMVLAVTPFLASRAAPTVRFGLKPAILEVKTRKDGDKRTERLSLQELLETRCQSLFSVFKPVWWLFKLVHSARGNFEHY